MADNDVPQKSVALIHNSALPSPLGKISTLIAEECQKCDCKRPEVTIHVLDVADFDIPFPSSTAPSASPQPEEEEEEEEEEESLAPVKRPLSDWQAEVSQHSGFILLFPYHVWSHCTPLKNALSEDVFPTEKYPRTIPSQPVLFVGFGKADAWHPPAEPAGPDWTPRTWSRRCFPMMREWAEGRGMKAMPPEVFGAGGDERWPEYNCFRDYWEDWEETGRVSFGGQQEEAFESAGWNRCQEGMRRMVDVLERRKTRGKR